MIRIIYYLLTGIIMTALFSCTGIPNGATAIQPFNKEKYLGKWYEIARFDYSFERDLMNTTAEYTVKNATTMEVLNKGYNPIKKKWVEAKGKAKFVVNDSIARLKVSFFGPFYAGYNVIALDKDYQYALVAGHNLSYLWILSRSTTIPDEVRHEYLKIANDLGFKTEKLIWVSHRNVSNH